MRRVRTVLLVIGAFCAVYLMYRMMLDVRYTVRQAWPFMLGVFVGYIAWRVGKPTRRS